ncbi:unnamed protein product [Enterobius vermicularis]|uniref:Phospholipid-transporting ATPase n=1 Tax=Enterobius vermicularis TaxID=51028 RepID=A0A0N4V6C1_ENTVE|nr:unnamed protein product [Enterobius vermicularis]
MGQIVVGDILKVEQNKDFPADLLLLSSSETNGLCYVETSKINGETNLTMCRGFECTSHLKEEGKIKLFSCEIECEKPNENLNEFTGTLITENENEKMRKKIESEFSFLLNCAEFFLLYCNLVPISLLHTLKIIRYIQAYYINNDSEMYDEYSNTPAKANTSALTDELGQVDLVICDKTGTLTNNAMKAKAFSVGGENYDFNASLTSKNKQGDPECFEKFFRVLTLCNDVFPQEQDRGQICYSGESPDEVALVRGAKLLGFKLCERNFNQITVKEVFLLFGAFDIWLTYFASLSVYSNSGLGSVSYGDLLKRDKDKKYEMLNTLEFTSDRKRMSVIVRCPDKSVLVCTKGAESVIYPLLHKDSKYLDKCKEHLVDYAKKGYRTMCFAYRKLQMHDYDDWNEKYQSALKYTDKGERNKSVESIFGEIEKDLYLAGGSAVEDNLQEDVPKTINFLMKAGIRVWMVTGDRLETARKIAVSCGICLKQNVLLHLTLQNGVDLFASIKQLQEKAECLQQKGQEFFLATSGSDLQLGFKNSCREKLMKLLLSCRSVICYGTSAIQKAGVVEMAQDNGKNVVLAIGDGANDVPMIQRADVGIGICGQEGLEAASMSDYSIGQFRFLERLLFIHGAWSFQRNTKAILVFFYKNVCFFLAGLWIALFSAFSGLEFFDSLSLTLFNLLITVIEALMLGIFFKPCSDERLLKQPMKYRTLREGAFTGNAFVKDIILAFFHSATSNCFSFLFMSHSVLWSNGRSSGWSMFRNSCNTVWQHTPFGADVCGISGIMSESPCFWLACFIIPVATLLIKPFSKLVLYTMHLSTPKFLFLNECNGDQSSPIDLDEFDVRQHLVDDHAVDNGEEDSIHNDNIIFESLKSSASRKLLQNSERKCQNEM